MRTIFVTNACRYAGPDAVRALAGEGHVYCHDASFLEAEVRNAWQGRFADVRALAEVQPDAALAGVQDERRAIDVLICNHFQRPEAKPLADTEADEFRGMLESLLVEPYQFVKAALPALLRSADPRIVFVTSAAPLRPGRDVSLYTSARAGANALVGTLAQELGPQGVAVFGIAPNYYASDDTYSRTAFAENERFRGSVQRNVPLQRLSNAQEMPDLLRFLCLQDSAFLTGQVFAFTGGWA